MFLKIKNTNFNQEIIDNNNNNNMKLAKRENSEICLKSTRTNMFFKKNLKKIP